MKSGAKSTGRSIRIGSIVDLQCEPCQMKIEYDWCICLLHIWIKTMIKIVLYCLYFGNIFTKSDICNYLILGKNAVKSLYLGTHYTNLYIKILFFMF
jgi:hypothetical protein